MCVCYLPPETPTGVTDLLNFLTASKHRQWNFIVMATSLYVGTSMLELLNFSISLEEVNHAVMSLITVNPQV